MPEWKGFFGEEEVEDVFAPTFVPTPSPLPKVVQPPQTSVATNKKAGQVVTAQSPASKTGGIGGAKAASSRPPATVLLDIGHALTNEPRPRDFSLPCLRAGTVGGLVSPGGAGKSMLAAQLALMVATGLDAVPGLRSKPGWQNLKTGKVHYASFEDGGEDAAARLYGIWKALGPKADEAAIEVAKDHLFVETLTGVRAPDLLDEDEWRDWVNITCVGKRLIVIDTLRMAHLGDENDSGQMARLMAVMQGAAMQSGAAILFLHHVSKGAALSGQGGAQQAARGSSVITDNARGQFFLSTMTEADTNEAGGSLFDIGAPGKLARIPLHGADDDGREMRTRYVRFGVAKSNYSAPWPDVWLRREDHGVLVCADIRLKSFSGGSSSGKSPASKSGAKLV
jgi:hypothetical protein